MFDRCRRWCVVAILSTVAPLGAHAQKPVAGDAPANPGPLATGLVTTLHSKDIRPVLRKVADWQLARLGSDPTPHSWDWGMLDLGLMAAYHTLGDKRYPDYVIAQAGAANWHIDHTTTPANDYAFAQALADASGGNARLMSAVRLRLDGDLEDKFDPDHAIWSRADVLFFEAPAVTQIAAITDDDIYLAFVHREWHRTEKLLYSPEASLFAANPASVGAREPNGKLRFEARANGMAIAGLVRVLASLPSDDPLRPAYVARLRQMAAAMAQAQQPDGLWRPALLDPASTPQPDLAASSLVVYALAWGISHRHLDPRLYLPVVERAWAGLLTHVYDDGRLGSIPPPDAAVAATPGSSWNYGVGAFLLAGGEVDALSLHKHW